MRGRVVLANGTEKEKKATVIGINGLDQVRQRAGLFPRDELSLHVRTKEYSAGGIEEGGNPKSKKTRFRGRQNERKINQAH